jgi:hypothetical protein
MSEVSRNRAVAAGVSATILFSGIADRLLGESAYAKAPSSEGVPVLVKKQLSPKGAKIALAPAVRLASSAEAAKRYADCEDAVLAEPDFGLEKVPDRMKKAFSGFGSFYGSLPPLTPYVNLKTVEADGEVCYDGLVQRIVTLFEKINGEEYPVLSVIPGNGYKGRFVNIAGGRGDQCGQTVQAAVKIEATTDTVRGFDYSIDSPPDGISRVYLSPPTQVVCEN